jgi:hypothetical protein
LRNILNTKNKQRNGFILIWIANQTALLLLAEGKLTMLIDYAIGVHLTKGSLEEEFRKKFFTEKEVNTVSVLIWLKNKGLL